MARVLIVAHYARTLVNFRGELIQEMINRGHEVIALGPEDDYQEKVRELGAEYVSYPLQRTGLNPWRDLTTLRHLVGLMKRYRPDLVFSYAVKPVIYGSLAARRAGVKRVYSLFTGLGFAFTAATGNRKQRLVQALVQFLFRIALRNNRGLFFQNPDDRDLLQRLGLVSPGQAVLVNGSGVNLAKYAAGPPPDQRVIFLLIARLLQDKGIREFVEAARRVKSKYPDAGFNVVGPFDSNPSAINEQEMDRWVKEGVITYQGEVEDVRPFIEQSSVYVLPSYREGTPRTILEAMAMGRPIITTDAPGCRETVQPGVNGFLVPVKDSQALAKAMQRFVEDPDLIRAMGKRSRHMAEDKYDVFKVNEVMLRTMGL